ncbi:epoxide hydrolase N-terminal domain-containing protein, partial [Clavibacter michiganensis]
MTHSLPLHVTDADLDDLRDRIRRTRWAPAWPVEPWEAGTDQATLRRLAAVWADVFDWRAREREIRALPWAVADLDGTPVSYLRFEAEQSDHAGGLPIVLTNGWPSSALEMVPLAERLSQPSRFGGDPGDAVTVIVPALPGFPFSPQRPRIDERTHELWHRLMT